MTTYRRYQRGQAGAGSIIVRIYRDGEEPKAFLRTVDTADDDGADAVYPSEETPPETALRLAGNKLEGSPGAQVLVELEPNVTWDPAWGTLEG